MNSRFFQNFQPGREDEQFLSDKEKSYKKKNDVVIKNFLDLQIYKFIKFSLFLLICYYIAFLIQLPLEFGGPNYFWYILLSSFISFLIFGYFTVRCRKNTQALLIM